MVSALANLPKISIVIPSFNQGDFIEATLLSLLDQKYPNLELIVIDGKSTDDTVEVIKKYSDRIIYWVSEKDQGQTDALIKGFQVATGEIWGWLNSDDLHEPLTLWEVAEFFSAHPNAQVVFGDCSWITMEGRPIRPMREIPFIRFIWLFSHNYIPQPSTFWRAALYRQAGGLDRTFNLAMDTDLWSRFSEETRIWHVNSYWSRFRTYPEQKNRALREQSDAEDHRIRARMLPKNMNVKLARAILFPFAKAIRILLKFIGGKYFWGSKKPEF